MPTPGIWRQESFAGGEISPDLYGRTDTVKYSTGLATCRNMIVNRSGSVSARPGTKNIGAATSNSRLIKFIFNFDDTMLLEFRDDFVRFYRYGELLYGEQWVSCSIAKPLTPILVTMVGHGYTTGDTVEFERSSGTTGAPNGVITVTGPNTFTLDGSVGSGAVTYTDNPCRRTAYVGGGSLPVYELPSPYSAEQVGRFDYVQSGDVLYIADKEVTPQKLTRTSLTHWEFSDATVVPSIAAPTGFSSTSTGAGYQYTATSIAENTFEESLAGGGILCTDQLQTISWTAVSGAREYNIYKKLNGKYGYIGTATSNSFKDNTINPDTTVAPPEVKDWLTDEGYPAAVAFYQQRLIWGAPSTQPSKVYASRVGLFNNFAFSYPLQDDDSISFSLVGRYVPAIKHMAEVGSLFLFTNIGEWIVKGDADGVLTPTAINARQISYNGSNTLRPIVYDSTLLYTQARGNVIRDFDYSNASQSYTGRDLTVFSSHLFDYHTSVSWDYSQTPGSIIWICRDDGTLLGQTYMKEHDVWGWHRHDSEYGFFKDVCSLPEDGSDATYFIIRRYRELGGLPFESYNIERLMDNIDPEDIDATWRVDNGLEYDGRLLKYDGTTSTATLTYDYTQGVTSADVSDLTSDVVLWDANEVGNSYVLVDALGVEWWLDVIGFTNSQSVRVRPQTNRPALFNGEGEYTSTGNWYRGVDVVTDTAEVLLIQNSISALCDGDSYVDLEYNGGVIEFPRTYKHIVVGITIESDMVTLPLDQKTRSVNTIVDKKLNFSTVDVQVKSSRSVSVGPDLDHLETYPMRTDESYGEPNRLITGKVTIQIDSNWYEDGQVAIKQRDPLPLTVLSINPGGRVG